MPQTLPQIFEYYEENSERLKIIREYLIVDSENAKKFYKIVAGKNLKKTVFVIDVSKTVETWENFTKFHSNIEKF